MSIESSLIGRAKRTQKNESIETELSLKRKDGPLFTSSDQGWGPDNTNVLNNKRTTVSIESFRTMCIEPQSVMGRKTLRKNELLRHCSSEIELGLEEESPFHYS